MEEYIAEFFWIALAAGLLMLFVARRRKHRHRQPSTFGGPDFAHALREAGQGRLGALHALIAGTTNADMKVAFLQGLSQEPTENVQRWTAKHATDPAAQLMLGEAMIVEARRQRGQTPSEALTEAVHTGIYEALTGAMIAFKRAAELAPEDATAWIRMCDLAAALQLSRTRAEGFFDEAVKRDPESFGAHVAMMSFLTEKLYGSHDEMFAFVKDVSANAPEDSDLHMLIAYACWERHHYYISSNESGENSRKYRDSSELRAQVLSAYGKSLGSPTYRNRPESVIARNYAAFWFFAAEMQPELKRELTELEYDYSMTPWGFIKDPMTTFADARGMAKL